MIRAHLLGVDPSERPAVSEPDALWFGTCYRSTPPMTGSIDATAAMTSAIMLPSHIAAVACRLVNDGSRKCTR